MKKFMEVKVMGYREAVDYVCIHKDNPKQTETLVIHCEQGCSRSVAVAVALLLVKTGSNEQIFGNTYYMPNMYVYYNLLETYGEQNNYWEECYEKEKKTFSKILLSEEQRKFMKLYEQFTKG